MQKPPRAKSCLSCQNCCIQAGCIQRYFCLHCSSAKPQHACKRSLSILYSWTALACQAICQSTVPCHYCLHTALLKCAVMHSSDKRALPLTAQRHLVWVPTIATSIGWAVGISYIQDLTPILLISYSLLITCSLGGGLITCMAFSESQWCLGYFKGNS